MKVKLFLLSLAFIPQVASSALLPRIQNDEALGTMVQFIKAHPPVMETLKSIDFKSFKVIYGNDCVAVFGRKKQFRSAGLVGPEAPLEFKHSTCAIRE